ncbi:Protein phosphatase 2C [Legionella nautarum]|uniref:Protein phosphatase 2C n=1 Tax=Legionella nautarum TaxID=45070 RepID=A0A0W0WWY5_9GAMM|nr:hypothetical protein [Legionella nautarum]KTD36810.1 Protein phosphatase 2C [Legionella nautarum]
MWLFNEDGSSELALELIQAIFFYFSIEDLARLALVCQWFNFYCKDNAQWQWRLRANYPEIYQDLVTRESVDYKAELRKLAEFRFFPIHSYADPKEPGKRAPQTADDLSLENLSYLATVEGRIGIAEFRGLTYPKLGRISAGIFQSTLLPTISTAAHRQSLASTVDLLQDCIRQLRIDFLSGAIVSGVTLLGCNVYTVNLGDCFAIAIVLNEENKVSQFLVLNRFRHRAAEKNEKERIIKAGGRVNEAGWIQNTVKGSCNLSRGLGNGVFERDGFSHQPDTYFNPIAFNENDRAFVILASRRLMRQNALTKEGITALFEEHHKKAPHEIAELLGQKVIADNSNASSSILITALDANAYRAKYMAVFEGFDDIEVAKVVSQLYGPVLEIKLGCAILCNFEQKRIKRLAKKIDQACSFLYTIFDGVKGERLRVNIPRFLQQAYRCYAELLTHLIDALALNEQNKINDCLQRVETYSAILLLPSRLEALLFAYFPENYLLPGERCYLKHPLNFINALRKSVLRVNKTNLLEIHTELESMVKDLTVLYKAAGVVLSIRKKYNASLLFDYDCPQKVWIHKLKTEVDFVFDNYPKEKTSVLVEALLNHLKVKNEMLSDTPIISYALQFFSGDDRLKWCLAEAIEELEKILVALRVHESNTEIEEELPLDTSPTLG